MGRVEARSVVCIISIFRQVVYEFCRSTLIPIYHHFQAEEVITGQIFVFSVCVLQNARFAIVQLSFQVHEHVGAKPDWEIFRSSIEIRPMEVGSWGTILGRKVMV